jgi:hypothetical protein
MYFPSLVAKKLSVSQSSSHHCVKQKNSLLFTSVLFLLRLFFDPEDVGDFLRNALRHNSEKHWNDD